jgi:hypothetical protein
VIELQCHNERVDVLSAVKCDELPFTFMTDIKVVVNPIPGNSDGQGNVLLKSELQILIFYLAQYYYN